MLSIQGLRLIIVLVLLGPRKIYVAAVEALRKKERQDETQFTTKIHGFVNFIPHWMLMYFFAGFLKISPCVWRNSGCWCCCQRHTAFFLNSLYKKYYTGKFYCSFGRAQQGLYPHQTTFKDKIKIRSHFANLSLFFNFFLLVYQRKWSYPTSPRVLVLLAYWDSPDLAQGSASLKKFGYLPQQGAQP